MIRTSLSAVLLLAAATFSSPASAEDIRSGIWGGAKPNEGAEVSTSELLALLKTGTAVLDVRSVKECAGFGTHCDHLWERAPMALVAPSQEAHPDAQRSSHLGSV